MFEIPKDRKPLKPGRISLLLGLTVLMFILLASRYGFALGIIGDLAR